MKRNLITFAVVLGIVSGGFMVARGEPNSGKAPANANSDPSTGPTLGPRPFPFRGRSAGHSPFMFDKFTEKLNLTPEQKAKIQPIVDQAKPQLDQIREEAMQKSRAVIEGTIGQVRAMLTPEQQAKLDEMKQAHEEARRAFQKGAGNDDSD